MLNKTAAKFLTNAINDHRFRLIPIHGSYHFAFRRKEGLESLSAYFNQMANVAPYQAQALNYSPIANLVYGKVSRTQKDDLAIITIDSKGLMPSSDILYCASNDGGRCEVDLDYISGQLEEWLGNKQGPLFDVLSKWKNISAPPGRAFRNEFDHELGLTACRRFFDFIGFPETIWEHQTAPKDLDGVFRYLFNEPPPADGKIFPRIVAQTHERNGNQSLADAVRDIHNLKVPKPGI